MQDFVRILFSIRVSLFLEHYHFKWSKFVRDREGIIQVRTISESYIDGIIIKWKS